MAEPLSFLDLGEDIIVSNIIPNLSVKDIEALKQTCKSLHNSTNESAVWAQLYKKTFGSKPTPFNLVSYKWPELFKLRSKSKLFTWGAPSLGRLGYSIRDVPEGHSTRHGFEAAVCKPTEVVNFKDTVLADISAGGFSFQILTSEGNLYSTGASWNGNTRGPGPDEADAMPPLVVPEGLNPIPMVRDLRNVGIMPMPFTRNRANRTDALGPSSSYSIPQAQPSPTPTPAPSRRSNNDIACSIEAEFRLTERDKIKTSGFIHENKIPSDEKLISVSSGRGHFIALDEKGNLWTWDHQRQDHGIKVSFIDPITKENYLELSKGRIITKAIAGWNRSCVYILNVGLIVWHKRDALPTGVPPNTAVNAHFHIIKGTSALSGPNKIIDIFAGESFICYITASGRLYRVDVANPEFLDQETPYEITTFSDYLTTNLNLTNSKFLKITGSFNHFAVFTDDDNVLIGSKNETSRNNMKEPVYIPELQKKEIISIAVGDYHYLALSRDGSVYTWGVESKYCGCFGLGDERSINSHGGISERSGIRLLKPTRVENIGKVVAIAAAGWHSSAIVADV